MQDSKVPRILFTLLLVAVTSARAAIWQPLDEKAVLAAASTTGNSSARRNIVPQVYRAYALDRAALTSLLASAPAEFQDSLGAPELELPLPDGSFGRFAVRESPVMEPALAAKFPEIKTYVGQGIDDGSASARIDLTPHGFHAMILSARGSVFIDPYWRDSDSEYVVYNKRDFAAEKPFACLAENVRRKTEARAGAAAVSRPTGASLRKYRLALACTGEYATAVNAPNPPSVGGALAAMVTTVNRVSAVYERDFAIRFSLIDQDDRLVYLDGNTDPYSNNDGGSMLGENQDNIDNVIGPQNYDFGHVFSTGGGGVAYLAVVCDNSKAGGVTGNSNPTGDPFDIDYVAHEMGHQFGADHTFNSTVSSCDGGNRAGFDAYEPGSGTTIMAYAGICGVTNLAPNSDDYFHSASYSEIDSFTSNGGCAAIIATGNSPPVIGALTPFTIPANTPFALTGNATDADGDTLSYDWEEFDIGSAQTTANPSSSSSNPVFRSYLPTLSPTRYFPSLPYILNNANTPPATVNNFATGEVLPTIARTMTFRLTVRDNHAGAGGSNWAATTVMTVNTGAAFLVTAPNAAATLAGGSQQSVTWNVAGTTANGINCANVKISFSADGGNTFPYLLAASTANNGSAVITLPQVATTQGRIKVEAVGNIFFDISDADLTVTSDNHAPTLSALSNITVARGNPTPIVSGIGTVSDAEGDALSITVSGVPFRATITPSIAGNSISLSALVGCDVVTARAMRSYPITITVTDSKGASVSGLTNLIVAPHPAPTLGSYSDLTLNRTSSLTRTPAAAATGSGIQYSVTPTTLPGGGSVQINQSSGAVTVNTNKNTSAVTTPIRVTAVDGCGAAAIQIFNVNVSLSAATTAASYFASYGLRRTDAGFFADPDGDGIVNLLEYALMTDPTAASRAGLPLVLLKPYADARHLAIIFTRRATATDLTYTVQSSSDLKTWNDLASSVAGAPTSGPGFVSETGAAPSFTVEVRDPTAFDPSSAQRRYLRLKVTSP